MDSPPRRRHTSLQKKLGLGCWIWWKRPDSTKGGPAQICLLVLTQKGRWAFVEYEGNGIWISEDIITEVVKGSGRLRKTQDASSDQKDGR